MGNQTSKQHVYQQYYESLRKNQAVQLPSDLSPYDILGVSRNFTWEELKESYKRQARLVHPDKGGSEQLFNIVTDAFKKLAYEYKMKQQDKQHHELKEHYRNEQPSTSFRPNIPSNENFHDKFNRVFEENRFVDDEDDERKGYGNIMAPSSKVREDIDIPKVLNKFNNNKFNQIFDKRVPVGKEVIIYSEPEPLVLAKQLQYTEIGAKTNDYTTDSTKTNGLVYTDYLKAHTESRLVDPRTIKERKNYRNVEEFESEREERTTKKLNEDEIKVMKRLEMKRSKEEDERIRRAQQRDELIDKHYQKTSKLFLQ